MKRSAPWLIPLALGVAAALLTWSIVTARIAPVTLVGVARDLAPGEVFTPDVLVPVEVHGNRTSLRATGIPHQDAALLFGRRVPRSFKQGELVLQQDVPRRPPELGEDEVHLPVDLSDTRVAPRLLRLGQRIGFIVYGQPRLPGKAVSAADEDTFTYLGPFRIVSVGGARSPEELEQGERSGSGSRRITVAVRLVGPDKKPDPVARQLLEVMHARGERERRIVEVVVHRDEPGEVATPSQP